MINSALVLDLNNTIFQLTVIYKTNNVPYTNDNSPGLTPIGPPMWQAEADTELTMSASSATAHELREGMKLTSKRNFSGERKTKD